MEQSEQTLLQLLAQDLAEHYLLVVQRYQQRLYAFALRLTGSPQDAEDMVQEAFVGAYVSLENYGPQRILSLKLQPWLYRVTLNVYQHHRRGARLHLVPLLLDTESIHLAIEDAEADRPEQLFERQEQRAELLALLAKLPEQYRIALTCYYFEHLNYQELADLLEQPIGTVKSTISRGIRLLRTMLAAEVGKEQSPWNKITSHKQA